MSHCVPIVRRCGWVIIGCLLLCEAGCSRSSQARRAAAANVPGAAAVRFLGNVHVIGTGGRFVLVQASVGMAVAGLTDGQALVCRGTGVDTATLRVSRERRPPFVVADVVSGEPHLGDEVFVEPVPNLAAKPAPPAAPSSTPAAPPVDVPPAAVPAPAPLFRTNPAPSAS